MGSQRRVDGATAPWTLFRLAAEGGLLLANLGEVSQAGRPEGLMALLCGGAGSCPLDESVD